MDDEAADDKEIGVQEEGKRNEKKNWKKNLEEKV